MSRSHHAVECAGSDRPTSLLERRSQLEALAGWADGATQGGRFVLVSGEAGIGKTSLVQAFLASRPSAPRVLRGACEPLSTPRPLAPLLDVAEAGSPLAGLIASADEPLALCRALLESLARHPGSMLVLEDVHWADDATLDLLRYLARRLADVPAMVLVTYRDDEINGGHPLRLLLGDIGAGPTVRRLTLSPLSESAVGELAVASGVDTHELWRRTGGNPFFVTEVLAVGGSAVPSTVSDAVLARAARLPTAARHLLDVAAVLDPAGDITILLRAAGSSAQHLDRCVEAGMLVVHDGVPAFRHELARLAVHSAIPPARRAQLHGVVLAALETAGAATALLAHHAEAAGDREATRRHAVAAAERAALIGSHRQAADQFARALHVLDGQADRKRAALLVRCSRECALGNRIERATAQAEEALRLWQALGDRLREGDTLSWLSRLAWMSERVADAERLARAAVEMLEALEPGVELARAMATLAQQLATNYGRPEAQVWGERAIRLAEELGAEDIAAQATIDIGLVRALADDPAGAGQIDLGVARARAARSDDHAGRGLFQLTRVAWTFLRHADVDVRAAAAEAFCDERGVEFWGDYTRAMRAHNLVLRGMWDEAVPLATELWRRTTPASPAVRTITVAVALGLVRLRRGEPDPDGLLDAACRRGAPLPTNMASLGLTGARAEAAWLAGRLPTVVDDLRAHWAGRPAGDGWWNAELLWWLHVAGAPEAEEQHTGFAGRVAGGWRAAAAGFTTLGLPYHRALALAESHEEKPLREALAIARDLDAPPLGRIAARRLRALGVRDIPRTGRRGPAAFAGLTAREQEVLGLLADGLRDAAIACRLHLSERTVNHHVSAVLRKLDAPSRTAAVARAARDGLLAARKDGQ